MPQSVSDRLRTVLIVAVVAVAAFAVGARRLDEAPVYLTPDEVIISLDAHALSGNGRDLRGRLLPLYFQMSELSDLIWYQPIIMYSTALVLTALPLSESAVRLPAALIGVVDIILMYLLARAFFRSQGLGLFAAGLLALTPAHFIHSRFAMDYIYPVPFIIGWLLCLVLYEARQRPWLLFTATLCLGLGFYSYIAAVMMMPLYVGSTCLVLALWRSPGRAYARALAGFVLPLTLVVAWVVQHPHALADLAARYDLYDASKLSATQGAMTFFGYAAVVERTRIYWDYFSPSLLFFNGGGQSIFTTRWAGVFLLPLVILLPLGMYRALAHRRTPFELVLLLGFATAPLAALILNQGGEVNRELEILPFAILLAAMGMEYLWRSTLTVPLRPLYLPASATLAALGAAYGLWRFFAHGQIAGSAGLLMLFGAAVYAGGLTCERTKRWRLIAVGLAVALVVQFVQFRDDYFTDYRVRSGEWFQRNVRGALEAIIERERHEDVPAVYLSSDIRWIDWYWRFYLIKHGRQEVLAKTVQFDPRAFDIQRVPAGSLLVLRAGDKDSDLVADALVETSGLRKVQLIYELSLTPSFVVLQR